MTDEQLRMIGDQAAAIAIDALNGGDYMIRQLADDAIALIAEVRTLRAKLGAVPVDDLLALYDGLPAAVFDAMPVEVNAIGDWLIDISPLPGDESDEDAPLTLASIDDENGDL